MTNPRGLRQVAFLLLLVGALLAPSPIPSHLQKQIAELFDPTAFFARARDRGALQVQPRHLRSSEVSGAFRCPSSADAQQYFTTGTYRVAPGVSDHDNWAKFFQDYMGVPYTSEWETEAWNHRFVYPERNTTVERSPSHLVMYHWHRFTSYTPTFAGVDEDLLFATPVNGNSLTSRNPYTEWANMGATVGMSPQWANRWRSASSIGGGGPRFGCPAMETSLQLIAFRGKDIRAGNYHWTLWREVMEDGIIYASVRWIQVNDACKNDYKTCPPYDPIKEGMFGTAEDPKYATRLFVKASDTPAAKEYMERSGLGFVDDGFLAEIRNYTSTRVFVHQYFNRTSLTRKFAGFGYSGFEPTTASNEHTV